MINALSSIINRPQSSNNDFEGNLVFSQILNNKIKSNKYFFFNFRFECGTYTAINIFVQLNVVNP